MIPEESDCEKIKDKYAAQIDETFFRSFELIESKPADEESFMLSIMDAMPSLKNVIAGITASILTDGNCKGASSSLVNTDANA